MPAAEVGGTSRLGSGSTTKSSPKPLASGAAMLSITSAAQQFKLPRDTLLNAVRAGMLQAARDRRGVLRIDEQALLGFCAAMTALEGQGSDETLIRLRAMRTDRLPLVLAQQRRLLREAETA